MLLNAIGPALGRRAARHRRRAGSASPASATSTPAARSSCIRTLGWQALGAIVGARCAAMIGVVARDRRARRRAASSARSRSTPDFDRLNPREERRAHARRRSRSSTSCKSLLKLAIVGCGRVAARSAPRGPTSLALGAAVAERAARGRAHVRASSCCATRARVPRARRRRLRAGSCWQHEKRLKMTKEEIKQEPKQQRRRSDGEAAHALARPRSAPASR